MNLSVKIVLSVVPVLLMVGCGSEEVATDPAGAATESVASEDATPQDDATPQEDTTSEAGLPACAEVWVDGQTLPEDYEGCLEDGTPVPGDGRYCEVGAELFTYDDSFYAAAGARVNQVEGSLADSEDYQMSAEACGG